MNGFLNGMKVFLLAIREPVITWAVIIAILLILLFSFNCFTSPAKLARKKLKALKDKLTGILPSNRSRKELEEDVPFMKLRDLSKDAVASQRLILAYYYDHEEDMKMKDLLIDMKKIYSGIEEAKSDTAKEDRKILGSILRNVEKRVDAVLAVLEEY